MLIGLSVMLALTLSMNRGVASSHGFQRLRAMYATRSGHWWAVARLLDDPAFTLAAGGAPELLFPGNRDIAVDVAVINVAPGHKRIVSRATYRDH